MYKGIEGKNWEELCHDPYKEMSKAAGVKKPNENQKAKALWKMRTVKDRRDDFLNPERKNPIVALDRALKCVENSCWRVCWPESLVEEAFSQWPVFLKFQCNAWR